MQASGVNQVQQGAHDAVDNLPSAGVSRHIRKKARDFGRCVAIITAAVPFCVGCIGHHYLLSSTELGRRLIARESDTAMKVVTVLEAICISPVIVIVTKIAEQVCMRPGGFIFERVCTLLDACERQAAGDDVPDRPE
ncbi:MULTISPECIES: hypothetical protein [unclassified Endozoicomonas]|uniref:hypothetical protein n=1 Tax=unclassified Endozoicomonas TaxID=2644528 RepID=UPI003BB4A5A3